MWPLILMSNNWFSVTFLYQECNVFIIWYIFIIFDMKMDCHHAVWLILSCPSWYSDLSPQRQIMDTNLDLSFHMWRWNRGWVNWTTQTKSDKTSKIGNNSSAIRIVSVVIIYNTQSQVCVYLLARDPVSLLHHHYFLQTWLMVCAILVNSFRPLWFSITS